MSSFIQLHKGQLWILTVIQLWQPRLNTPFIYQFFNCRKGLIQRTKFSGSRQFGTFSLWCKLRWKSTPAHVRRGLQHPLFGRRVQLWEVIQDLGSNSVKRFHMEKRIRSNEFGQQGCYFIRRLASTWVNHNDPMPSTPSTVLWPFGKQNESLNRFLFVHLGFWHLIGLVTFGDFSRPVSPRPRHTTPRSMASSSPSTHL